MNNYQKLVDYFISTNELGHHNVSNHSICLYDIRNNPLVIIELEKRIRKITKKFKLVILNPKEKISNISILDIDL